MPFDRSSLPPRAQELFRTTQRFAAGLMPGPEFETAYLRLRMQAEHKLPPLIQNVISEIFYGVDDYVSKDDIRDPANGDIDEEQLREIVRTQLRRLDQA
jgi:hypothetical protein